MLSKNGIPSFACGAFAAALLYCAPVQAQMSPDMFISRWDTNGDGKVSKEEFSGKRRPFSSFDTDSDGFATRQELEAVLGSGPASGPGGGKRSGGGAGGPMLENQVPLSAVGNDMVCAISRYRKCDMEPAKARGLFPTGLRPSFPDGLVCHGIDEGFAKDYGATRGREAYHGGIDMPANWGTPMRAMADGMVLTNTNPKQSARGIEVIIRHTPDDTGIPLYIYSQYAHLDEPSHLKPGQRVRMGDIIGPTGNSGTMPQATKAGATRRPAIHFAIWYSDKPGYAIDPQGNVIPVDGWWMDPTAVYRLTPPFDSKTMEALPEGDKWIGVPVMVEGGGQLPAGTRLIWPYACNP
ncbi:MAG: peptidoglycan DD-metalloendopeptidase family protein [Rhodospirillales bacterium]